MQQKDRKGRAKNVIFFLGDGMGISTLTAARILKGQQQELLGPERALLSFEEFPNVCLARTYCLDSTVADSACSATAYLGGVKTNIGTLGVSGGVKYKECKGQALPKNQVRGQNHLQLSPVCNAACQVPSILAWAQASGLATGVVTTDQITGASPAAAYRLSLGLGGYTLCGSYIF